MLGIIKEISIIKTIMFNFHYFEPQRAIHFPVLVGRNIYLGNMGERGSLILGIEKMGAIQLGLSAGSFRKCNGGGYWNHSGCGVIEFCGTAIFPKDAKINVTKGGNLVIGNNFTSNSNVLISCEEKIVCSEDTLLGWNVSILDGDGHTIRNGNREVVNEAKPIFIGKHTWISSGVTILKGTTISEGCVIGANSTVSGKFEECNSLIVGVPARKVKQNITWER